MKRSILIFLAAIVIASALQAGTVPSMMNYQGRLTNQVNLPLDTVINMTFRIYPDDDAVTPLWTEQQVGVVVRNGLFTVLLGSTNPILDTVFKSDTRWIGVQVGDDVEMSPRRQFATVAYAFRAAYADSAKFIPVGDSVWSVSNGNAWRMNGNVGIGTNSPANRLEVNGDARFNELGFVGSWPEVMFNAHSAAGIPRYSSNGAAFSIFHAKDLNRLEIRKAGIGTMGNQVYFDPTITLTEQGKVGIGTSVPDRTLTISVPVGTNDMARFRSDNGNADIIIGTAENQVGQIYTLGGQGLSFGTDGGIERIRIASSGNIGIGTPTPVERLHLQSGRMLFTGGDLPYAFMGGLKFATSYSGWGLWAGIEGWTSGGLDQAYLRFFTAYGSTGERMRITPTGLVGINTTNPTAQLEVVGNILGQTSIANVNAIQGTSSSNYSGVAGFNTGTGPGVYGSTVSTSSESPGVIGRSIATTGSGRGVYGSCDSPGGIGVFGAVVSGGTGVYGVEPAGGSGFAVYADGDAKVTGKMSIGAPSLTNILTVAQGAPADPIADAWTTYSSRRWKENITSIENALELVQRLDGVYFDWKSTGQHDLGFIAEEVGKVVPEVVEYELNGIDAKSVDYARLTALLVEAIKEQQREISALRQQVQRLAIEQSTQANK